MRSIAWCAGLIAAALSFCTAVHAQDASQFPRKPVRLIVPVPPGGGVDALARMIAEGLRAQWGQSVIVENRAGAGGNIGAEVVYKADPDGYTLMFTAGGVLTINKALYARVNFEPENFVPVSIVAASYSILVANSKAELESVQQLIAFAKAKPTKLDYASPGAGTGSHLTAELFKSTAGIHITHIPYKGGAPAMADVLAGQVPLTFAELGTALPHIRSGKLRALAVTSEKRNPSLPDVPTVSETLPGFVATPWNGMAAPPQTPIAIARRISSSVAEVIRQPDVAKRLTDRNFQPIGSTPEEMERYVKQEIERWEKVIRVLGLRVD